MKSRWSGSVDFALRGREPALVELGLQGLLLSHCPTSRFCVAHAVGGFFGKCRETFQTV